MNVLKLKKIALALGSLALLGAATEASAFPEFTIQPGAIKPTAAVVGGVGPLDTIKGGASERLFAGAGNTFSGNGLITLDTFFEGGNGVYSPKFSGGFQLYITFFLKDTLATGTFGAPNSTYTVNQLDFKIWADPLGNDSFSTATSGNDPTASNNADDFVISYGSLLNGNATINVTNGSQGGAINSAESFSVCSGVGTSNTGGVVTTGGAASVCTSGAGSAFWVAPSPFYNVVLDEFNNTSSVFDPVSGTLVLTGGSGSINFAIPEPSSVALFGVALVGMGLAARRRRNKA